MLYVKFVFARQSQEDLSFMFLGYILFIHIEKRKLRISGILSICRNNFGYGYQGIMITCAANGCPSTQTTKIDGSLISFFAFPEDDLRKKKWLHNCNLASGVVNDKKPLHLCELHFEKGNFTASKDLKSSAVPTLFGKIEAPPVKRKIEDVEQTTPEKVPLKQKKLDENTLVTPPQSPFTQDNVEDAISGSKTNDCAINGSAVSSLEPHENLETKEKTYCLIIQIDKVRCKPASKCEKDLTERKSQKLQTLSKKICAAGSCKLKKCTYNSKPALQCSICDQYYIIKSQEDNKSFPCSICSKIFPTPQSLYVHIRKHFICDMCQTECTSQIMYDKHAKLHVSTDPLHPYKCNQCLKTFELKEGVKQHCLTEHPTIKLQSTVFHFTPPSSTKVVPLQNDYRCTSCNVNFKSDQAYRSHISNLHKKKESSSNININEVNNIIVPNPLTGSQIGILQPVKFSCRVCSKEFDNVREVDLHTRTHLEEDVDEDLKCNICKKVFKSSTAFSEHLKHHLSRAYPCPICSKAFINRTTLKIHLKTHSDS